MSYPMHFMLHPTAYSSDQTLLDPPNHTTAQCLSPGITQHRLHNRPFVHDSDSESSVEDSICFLPYNMSCPTHNISGPRCALSYINYLHGAVIRHMVPPSDSSPWVPPDESMELQRYNARKRGIAFPTDRDQGDTKRQDTSSSSSSSSSSSPSTSIPPTLQSPLLRYFDKVIFDSGASRSGTGRSQRLTSIEPVSTSVSVTPKFGPSMTPTHQHTKAASDRWSLAPSFSLH